MQNQFAVMNRRSALMLAGGAALFAAGAGRASAQGLESASLRLKWLPQTQFAGYYVALAKGYYKDEGIDLTINPGGPNIVAENMVASASDTFGHGGGYESLISSREKNLPLVGISVLFQKTPFTFVAKRESGIKDVNDFRGKKISAFFTGSQFILYGMLTQAGIPLEDVTVVPHTNMAAFVRGDIDVACVTYYNELLALYRDGIKDLVFFDPTDFGIVVPREIIVAREETIQNNPKLVQGFLNASLRGWKDALVNRKEAVDAVVAANPTLDPVHQTEMLDEVAKLMLFGPGEKNIGYMDQDALEYTQKFMVDNKVIAAPVDLDKAVDRSFFDKVPQEYRTI